MISLSRAPVLRRSLEVEVLNVTKKKSKMAKLIGSTIVDEWLYSNVLLLVLDLVTLTVSRKETMGECDSRWSSEERPPSNKCFGPSTE